MDRLTTHRGNFYCCNFDKEGKTADEIEQASINTTNAIFTKLGQIEDIEEEFGFDIRDLFTSDYTGSSFEMEFDDDDMIYYDGDSFHGRYSKEAFLSLIKDMLNMYKYMVMPDKRALSRCKYCRVDLANGKLFCTRSLGSRPCEYRDNCLPCQQWEERE